MLTSDNPTKVTETQVLVFGGARPGEIVDRRLNGRLIVADPGKANAWLVLDGAEPPKGLMKALKGLASQNHIRIVVPKKDRPEAVAEAIAVIEAFMTNGSAEKSAKREAASQKAAATRAAERVAKAEAERAAARSARAAALEEERRRVLEAGRPAREAAAAAEAAEQKRLRRVRAQRTVFVKDEAPAVGVTFFVQDGPDGPRGHHVVAESHGASWVDRDGDTVCYVYWRAATDAERAAWVAVERVRPRPLVVTLPVEVAPRAGETFRLRDGTEAVAVDVRRRRYVSSSDESDDTSFYSSELWDRTVVDVEYTPRA